MFELLVISKMPDSAASSNQETTLPTNTTIRKDEIDNPTFTLNTTPFTTYGSTNERGEQQSNLSTRAVKSNTTAQQSQNDDGGNNGDNDDNDLVPKVFPEYEQENTDALDETQYDETRYDETRLLIPNAQRRLLPGNHENGENEDEDDNLSRIVKLAKRPSFILICCLGILALIILNLTFLPRTSLARDYRRWYGIHLTKSDVKRNFLRMTGIGKIHDHVSNEEHLDHWLQNFTEINSKAKYNMIHYNNPELLSYVESSFKKFGFHTEQHFYDINVPNPKAASVTLKDSHNLVLYRCDILEPGFKTPAFYAWGAAGNVSAPYVYVNHGSLKDYVRLLNQSITLKGKIFIFQNVIGGPSNITIEEKFALAEYYGAVGVLTYTDFSRSEFIDSSTNKIDYAISRGASSRIIKIPTIPISKALVQPILTRGKAKPNIEFADWEFFPEFDPEHNLQLQMEMEMQKQSYYIGDGEETDASTNEQGSTPQKLGIVVGTLKGIINDADIIIGARRDSLTSENPLSGHAIMLEIMRNFQKLVKQGWKPLRNIKFISWDASHLDLVGLKSYIDDSKAFNLKRPVLSYINIDGDVIMGSHFLIDANPLFNHILRKTSKYIPIPRNLTRSNTGCVERDISVIYSEMLNYEHNNEYNGRYSLGDEFRALFAADDGNDNVNDNDGDGDGDDDDDFNDDFTTLHHLWKKQDQLHINNNLGWPVSSSEFGFFQQHLAAPVINVKFANDEKRDGGIYVPNSNFYSRKWLIEQSSDRRLHLHGALVKYVGLLAISLSEHEVADYHTHLYFKEIETYYKTLLTLEQEKISNTWADLIVPNYLIYRYSIFQDLDTDDPVTFKQIVDQFSELMNLTVYQSQIFDNWNDIVEDGLTRDYPWYRYYKKLQHFAQFKVSNYKLTHLERDLQLTDQDITYLSNKDPQSFSSRKELNFFDFKAIVNSLKDKAYYHYDSVIYGNPKFNVKEAESWYTNRTVKSTFTQLYEAIDNEDYELTVKWFVLIYEKLINIQYKMT